MKPSNCVRTTSDDRELQSAITMALYRHQAETKLRKMERWLAATLNSVGDAVLAVDIEGLVTYPTPAQSCSRGGPFMKPQAVRCQRYS